MGEIKLGSEYELKRQAYSSVHHLGKKRVEQCMETVKEFFDNNKTYFMMLCHERRDYTVFNIQNDSELAVQGVLDVIYNRGKPVDIGYDENKTAIEIWIKFPTENEEVHCYYLFPYDDAVIEV